MTEKFFKDEASKIEKYQSRVFIIEQEIKEIEDDIKRKKDGKEEYKTISKKTRNN